MTVGCQDIDKMLSYRRETALQSVLQFSLKVEDWNWETIFYGHYRSVFNHCDIIDQDLTSLLIKASKKHTIARCYQTKPSIITY